MVALLADARDELIEAAKATVRGQAQEGLILAHLDDILHLLTGQTQARRRCLTWVWVTAGVVVCAVWFVAGWEVAQWVHPEGRATPAVTGHPTGGKR